MEEVDERTRRELALTRKLYIVWAAVALALGVTFCYIVANAFQARAPVPIVVGQVDDFALNSVTLMYVNANFLDPETHKALETLPLDVSRDASGNFTIFFARSTDPERGVLIPRQCAVDWDAATLRLVEP